MARMMIDAVEGRTNPVEIIMLIQSQGWPKSEQIERLTHALSVLRISRGNLYARAQQLYREVGSVLQAT